MQNIYLIGFMGTGKSAVAGLLAERLCWQAVETDQLVEEQAGCSIVELFAAQGESAFRKMEHAVLTGVSRWQHSVVSCGGGIILDPENIRAMRNSGITVLLTATPKTICARLQGDQSRPLLQQKTPEQVAELLTQRLEKYTQAADITVATDAKTVDVICCEILDLLPLQGFI